MILTCNSCGKKFVVPDSAITDAGRMVQCGSCGNKWKQFPINQAKKNKIVSLPKQVKQASNKPKKVKTKIKKQSREISLYSPEYLAKKHGIKLNDVQTKKQKISKTENISFGFYNTLILFFVVAIILARILYFTQDIIVSNFPFLEFYLNYFFESMRNVFEIWKSLISNY